jgi:two-component sensor histidine kinase
MFRDRPLLQSDSVAVKAALLDVVDFLQLWADVHRALHMPDRGRLTDAARYLQQLCFSITKYRLDRLAIRVLFSSDNLRLGGERCWKLGLIVSELLTKMWHDIYNSTEGIRNCEWSWCLQATS